MITAIRAQKSDVETVRAILNHATRHKRQHDDHGWGVFSESGVAQIIRDSETYLFYRNHEPVATVGITWEDAEAWGEREQGDASYIQRLAVAEGFHGQDIGAQVLEWTRSHTKSQQRRFVRLDCGADNQGLCAYYESHNFERIATKSFTEYPDYTAALYERRV